MAVNINIPSQVSQTITDGVTDKAPSENAVNDALALKANTVDLGATAFSNDYNDLDNLPSIPAAQVNSDWNATSGVAEILNKPTIPSVTGFVPYTGASQDVDLGTYNLTADHINLNVSPSGAGFVVGSTQWNNTLGSSETLLKGGSVTLKNGVDLVARIVNKVVPNTTLTKAQYQAVKVSGATGGRLSVGLAQANTDLNSADTIGLVTETIATNQEGFILTVGQIENINTTGSLQGETWADGDVLYLSPTVAGKLTNIKPTGATGHIVVIGYVEYSHANNGKIYVKIMNGWELDELHNVYINPLTLADNNLLQYDSATSLWKNESLSTAGVQPTLTSGTNIKTINGTSILGSGDITVGGGITVGTTAVTSGTVGRIFFQGTGNVVQQDAGFIFDSTAKTLTNYGKGALSSNTSFGALALSGNTSGTSNTAFGNGALQFAGSGANNTAVGFYALNNAAQGNFTGTGNIGIGYNAGAYIISGQNNVAIGYSAGGTLTTGSRNTIIGAASLASNSTNNNVVISDGAGNNAIWKDANHFVGIGHNPTSGTLAAKLDVRAQGALSTDIAFRVRNSADTANIVQINGDGSQAWFTPANNTLNSIRSGTFNLLQYGNDAFGNIALGYNSSNMIVPTTGYNTVLGASASSGASSNFAIGIGWGSVVNGTGNICIGRTRTIGDYSIKIGYDGGNSQYGGTNSIHLGRTTSGNDILADNVFMTYFNSQSSSTLTRSNGSFGLLGQQAYIITNGTGALGLTTFMGDGGNTFVVRNHPSVPSTNIADSFQQYSADIVAGNAAPHFRTENGNIVKLYRQNLPTNPTTAEIATFLSNLGLANLV